MNSVRAIHKLRNYKLKNDTEIISYVFQIAPLPRDLHCSVPMNRSGDDDDNNDNN